MDMKEHRVLMNPMSIGADVMDATGAQVREEGRWGLEGAFAFALLQFAIVTATLLLTRPEASLAWFWPANAVAVAVLVCCATRLMVPAGVLSYVAATLANILYGDAFWFSIGINAANLVEVTLCAMALRWAAGGAVTHLSWRLMGAAGLAVVPAAAISGMMASIIVAHTFGADQGTAWRRWVFGDVISMLTVLPLAILVIRGRFVGVLESVLPRGLRARLALVWLLALVPLVTLAVARLQTEKATAVRHAQEHALDMARAADLRFQQIVHEATLTARFALSLEEAMAPGPACQERVAALAAAATATGTLHIARPDGTIYCSSADPPPSVSMGDREYFRRAVATREPVISGYIVGRTTGKPVIVVAYPKVDGDGTVRAVALPGIELPYLASIATELMEDTNGLAMTAMDGDGLVLLRHPEGESWAGRRLNTDPEVRIDLPDGEALYDMMADDGWRRVGAFTPIPGGGLLAVSYRHDLVVQQAVQGFLRGLASLVVVLAGALGALWFLLDRLALRGLSRLEEMAADIRDGRPPRPELVEGAEEIRTLARALADTASNVSSREELLREARWQAERANRSKSGFLSSMSHELRTPLNAILGFGQMLEMGMAGPLTPKQQEYLRDVVLSATSLLALIDDLFDLGDIESGRLRIELRPVRLAPLVEDLAATLAPQAAAAGVALRVAMPDDLVVVSDPRRLGQIAANLLTNAIKYNRPDGEVLVSAERLGNRVRLSVRDTGLGIPPGREAEVFEPSNRLGREATGIPGTGLGLAISRRLALQMGGDIAFAPVPGGGTLFWVDLPEAATGVVGEVVPDYAPAASGAAA